MADAQTYAAQYGVTREEALRRMWLERHAGKLNAALEANEYATLAGLWIQHKPDFRVIASFTEGGTETIRPYTTGGPLEGIVEVRQAAVTLADLKVEQMTALQIVRNIRMHADTEVDVIHNRVKLGVLDRNQLDAALANSGIRLPERDVVAQVEELLTAAANVYGGYVLNYRDGSLACTAGYSVKNSSGTTGISTAGHCGDTLQTSSGQDIYFVDEWYFAGLPYDVQWHTTPNLTDRPWVKDDSQDTYSPNYREVWGWIGYSAQAIGDWVCKYGRTTGYDCGTITSKTVVGAGPGGSDLDNTFIRVDGGATDIAQPGDSGGPWYDGNYAIGMMHAQIADDAVYMAINYVQQQGLTIRTICGDQQC